MAARKKYPDELTDRGVRLVFESGRPIAHVARDLGVSAEALRKRVRRAEVDAGKREGLTTDEREKLKRLRAEVFELRRANSILKEASVFFCLSVRLIVVLGGLARFFAARPVCGQWSVSLSCRSSSTPGSRPGVA